MSMTGSREAWPKLAGGGSALDAVCTVAEVAERDEAIDSVGRGGLPDATGRMTLDACVMLGPAHCGAVAGVSRHLAVTRMARAVMERTPHVMLVGAGADSFADSVSIPEEELLSEGARLAWEDWKAGHQAGHDDGVDRGAHRPLDRGGGAGALFGERRWIDHDTVGAIARDTSGRIAGACTTSGLPFKLPGRVGDSPIPGHGLYVDPEAGAATATGAGELVMGVCGSFLAVECMRRGASPADALVEVLRRIERSRELKPSHQVAMIALSASGSWASAALREGFLVTVTDALGTRTEPPTVTLRSD
jgi:N4-(beta-N-acetylglucosaminyl)-L-asparaginase